MTFFITVIFAFTVLGSCLFVAFFGKKWNLDALVAFSSGGLLVICFLDFMSHSFEDLNHSEMATLLILSGVLLQGFFDIYIVPRLKFLDRLVEKTHSHSVENSQHHHTHILSASTVCSTVGCLTVCSFFDGIRLFAGLSLEGYAAVVTSVGLFFHLLSEGVLVAILGIGSNIKTKIILLLTSCISVTLILGAYFAKNFAEYFNFHYLIALATGMLLYICFIHLIPFSIKGKSKHWFFVGLIVFIGLHYLFH